MLQWLSDLRSIVILLREQNLLMRELIQALTHQPAQTTPSQISAVAPSPPPTRRSLSRQFTAKDVSVVTPERRLELAIEQFEKEQRPWRLQDLPADLQEIAMQHITETETEAFLPTSATLRAASPTPSSTASR